VRDHPFFVETVGDRYCLRMVGDGDVFVSQSSGGSCHLLDRILSVARRCVHLQVALHVFQLDEFRQPVFFGSLDLSRVFA
jgi:hypothetical protein